MQIAAELPLSIIHPTGNDRCENALRRLEVYDFNRIIGSCIEKYQWDRAKAEAVARRAKQFLAFAFLDPYFYHIPEEEVDNFWHRMILDTKWYHQFCEDIFGFYYHHSPILGNEQTDQINRNRSVALAQHWYGEEWRNLVTTCTQCRRTCTAIALHPIADNLLS